MPFADWDPIVRDCVFGGVFLVSLLAVLWVWYDTSGRADSGRWVWRLLISTMVALTSPAVVLGAANLDVGQQDLLATCGWVAIGSGAIAIAGVLVYTIWGRSLDGETEYLLASDLAPVAAQPAVPTPTPEPPTLPTPVRKPVAPRPAWPAPAAVNDPFQDASGAYLFVKSGPDHGRRFAIGNQITIGRARSCGLALGDPRVSAEHAQVRREDGTYVFLDLKSTNGSYLLVGGREERLRSSQALVDGDEIRVGQTVLQFIRTTPAAQR
jgi:hypothetical protein